MKNLPDSQVLDRTAIGLSALCLAHCLVLPLLLALAPSLAALPMADEDFHLWLVYLVLPTSLLALFLGCRRHRRWTVLAWGLSGVGILLIAALVGHDGLGEAKEKALTVMGSVLVAIGHGLNFINCRSHACAT